MALRVPAEKTQSSGAGSLATIGHPRAFSLAWCFLIGHHFLCGILVGRYREEYHFLVFLVPTILVGMHTNLKLIRSVYTK